MKRSAVIDCITDFLDVFESNVKNDKVAKLKNNIEAHHLLKVLVDNLGMLPPVRNPIEGGKCSRSYLNELLDDMDLESSWEQEDDTM